MVLWTAKYELKTTSKRSKSGGSQPKKSNCFSLQEVSRTIAESNDEMILSYSANLSDAERKVKAMVLITYWSMISIRYWVAKSQGQMGKDYNGQNHFQMKHILHFNRQISWGLWMLTIVLQLKLKQKHTLCLYKNIFHMLVWLITSIFWWRF